MILGMMWYMGNLLFVLFVKVKDLYRKLVCLLGGPNLSSKERKSTEYLKIK